MWKHILSFFILAAITQNANAQEISNNAIGLRLGSGDGFGGEISYQKKLTNNNRLELDLGIRSNQIKLTGVYQWIWEIDNGFNWYAGIGGGIGSNNKKYDSGAFLSLDGDVGLEYLFDFPLQLSLDLRPEFAIGNNHTNFDQGIALGARYRF